MASKAVLILIDGMRPDGVQRCGEAFPKELVREGSACFQGRTVMPSITLPCHASLFFSMDPERHGILTNEWRPMARPIDSLGDVTARYFKRAAMFYNWEPLRDLNRPGSLCYSHFQTLDLPWEKILESERNMTRLAVDYLQKEEPDFLFLYLGGVDNTGHQFGWMTDKYLRVLANAWQCVKQVKESLPQGYHLVVTADHGGHDRDHGLDIPEDMTIPLFFWGPAFAPGKELENVSIKDIAPTIAYLMGMRCPPQWEGRNVLQDQ